VTPDLQFYQAQIDDAPLEVAFHDVNQNLHSKPCSPRDIRIPGKMPTAVKHRLKSEIAADIKARQGFER
jgi:hypothetical protein